MMVLGKNSLEDNESHNYLNAIPCPSLVAISSIFTITLN